jgi:thiamine-phosphate diphosphorylase
LVGGLYVLIDPAACIGRDPVEIAAAALRGGASMIQWRDKLRDKGEQLAEATAIFALCRQHDATFIANDHADLALALGMPVAPQGNIGVHLGQKDLPLGAVRRMLPAAWIVGISTNNPQEALAGQAAGASYVAVGDIFGTTAKQGTRPASPARLTEVKAAVSVPVIGIGGINRENLHEVIVAGADGIAVISAVCGAADPEAAARELVEAIASARRAEPER